jgi:hypothetical protein
MKTIATLLTCATLGFGLSGTAAQAAGPDPRQVHIVGLQYGGTGCPAGTAAVDLSEDRQAFTVIFDQFVAHTGPGVSITESRKNCQLNLTLHVPHGFTFGIASVDYRGFADIARGDKGMQKASYYFQGQAPTASTWRPFNGRYQGDWQLRDEVEWASIVWAPCGVERALNINSQLRVDKLTSSSSAQSMMTMDSEDGQLEQIYHVVWRTCP